MVRLDTAPEFRPKYSVPSSCRLDVAKVWKTEEKGSDVNLGVHLVRDAAKNHFDVAGVLTNDTDLCTAIQMVRQDFGKDVYLLSPTSKPATSLVREASTVRHVSPYIGPSRYFSDPVTLPDGTTVSKPSNW